jgi:uncharacterized protein
MLTGTLINAGAVLLGSSVGLASAKEPSPRLQVRLKLLLGVLVVYSGLSTTWKALGGTGFLGFFKQIAIVLLSIVIGNAVGRGLRIQDRLNKVGDYARRMMSKTESDAGNRFSEGFVTCTLLFCIGPMAIIGALQDGLDGNWRLLGLKSVMDGLAAMAFARTFGAGVMLSALPVLAYQGSISLAAQTVQPYFDAPGIKESISATGGLIVICIAVVIFEIQKVPLANYLPALVVAPLLAWWWGF